MPHRHLNPGEAAWSIIRFVRTPGGYLQDGTGCSSIPTHDPAPALYAGQCALPGTYVLVE